MDLKLLSLFAEEIRQELIGDPSWVPSKNVFEYPNRSIEVVSVLKLVRACHGVNALNLLCSNGLFVDMGAVYRCVTDAVNEVHFLLECYPEKSNNVQKFIEEFFSKTIDAHLTSDKEMVQSKKIHSAMVRAITGRAQDEAIYKQVSNIYKAFSGYVHGGYAHIMQMFGGRPGFMNFNISGIKNENQIEMNFRLVQAQYTSVMLAMVFATEKFGLSDLNNRIRQSC